MNSKMKTVATILFAISCWSARGFAPLNSNIKKVATISTNSDAVSTTSLCAGGFGGGMGKKSDKKKNKNANKEIKLKPKQQWDRYANFKREPKIQVGVRIQEGDSNEWLEVGRIKSKDSLYTEAAVFRQRGIIAGVCTEYLHDSWS